MESIDLINKPNHYYKCMAYSDPRIYRRASKIDDVISEIIKDICVNMEIKKSIMFSDTRKLPYPQARSILCWVLSKKLGLSREIISSKINSPITTITARVLAADEMFDNKRFYPLENRVKRIVVSNFNEYV